MSNLAARVLTAALIVPVLLVAIFWTRPVGVFAVVLVATAFALREWFAITTRDASARALGVVLGIGYSAAAYGFAGRGAAWPALGVGVVMAAFTGSLARVGDTPASMRAAAERAAVTAFGILYCGLLAFLPLLKREQGARGWAWIILLLTVTWLGDTGAYAAGRIAGRHKLYPRVSPGKTWEGAIGGLLTSFGAAALAHVWYMRELSWGQAAALALPAGALGQIGDLCESMLKRAYGVKDSGALLPGHGGMLDRIDALLFTAPYFYFYSHFAR
jgi:phosphatidate cytidylyltransferase